MEDVTRTEPVCGDLYAERFMDESGRRVFAPLKEYTNPNASNVARQRIVDDLLQQHRSRTGDSKVVLIGCGFDSRAHRLNAGKWFELDEPQLIAYKNERLPVPVCNNEVRRIAIDFATGSLQQKLARVELRRPICVVIEGGLMYLEPEQIKQALDALRGLWPRHKLICDLMSKRFFRKYSRAIHDKIQSLGAQFRYLTDQPENLFPASGYRRSARIFIVGRAIDFRTVQIPRIVFKLFLRSLNNGYSVQVVEAD